MRSAAFALVLICLAALSAHATIRLVPQTYSTIQEAIDASLEHDTILIAPGIYRGPKNRNLSLHALNLTVKSSAGAEATIIDCEHLGRGFAIDGFQNHSTRIEELTILNGDGGPYSLGGGIYCAASPTISHCRFLNCRAQDGAGLLIGVFSPIVDGCEFIGNTATYGGGGVAVHYGAGVQITNCLFYGNSAVFAGGVGFGDDATSTLTSCTIVGNYASEGAGGIYSNRSTEVERCIVWGNCTDGLGAQAFGSEQGMHFVCSAIDTTGLYVDTPGQSFSFDDACVYSDPRFCQPGSCPAPAGSNYALMADSPCLTEQSPCGELIGALGFGCGAPPATGACCLAESCTQTTEANCAGAFLGIGSVCEACATQVGAAAVPVDSKPRALPNPSSGSTTISFSLARPGWASLRIYDASGRSVRLLSIGEMAAGPHAITWDGRSDAGDVLPAGIYFSRVQTGAGVMNGRIVRR